MLPKRRYGRFSLNLRRYETRSPFKHYVYQGSGILSRGSWDHMIPWWRTFTTHNSSVPSGPRRLFFVLAFADLRGLEGRFCFFAFPESFYGLSTGKSCDPVLDQSILV